ncbi:MAG: DUF1343 domain-containing protein [Polyangiaceae bacterium]|nr:DUF1343 domain-containing protein [Polyangiaceae bacterium]
MNLGLDRLASLPKLLARMRNARLGVLAHPASVSRDLLHIADILEGLHIRPALLFGPEHGYGGEAQDMIGVPSAKDPRSGAPIISLYGDHFENLTPSPEHLASIDLLLIDLADIGSRYYTFIWTALLALRAAARASVHTVILDRPNPISGDPASVEGATQKPGFLSFVGLEPVPIRHALTIGEIVAHFARRDGLPLGPDGALSIAGVEGWDRSTLAAAWDRPFILPSPNMPTADTALVYPGGCLLEGTNLSEGRGTTRPFEIVGAPWIDGRRLANDLASTGFEGFIARPLTFRPTFQKHAGQICGGVQIHVTQADRFRPVAVYTALIAFARRQNEERFRFRTERYEYIDTIPALDLLTGSDEARLAMEAGGDPVAIANAASKPDPAWPDTITEASRLCRSAEAA